MKRLFTILVVMALAFTASAVPARRGTRTVKNSDGRVLTISLRGDETFHYHVTDDGTPVRQNEKGDWVRDTRDVETLWTEASARRNAHRKALAQSVHKAMKSPRRGIAANGYTGTKKGLLILVNFQDVKFINSDAKCMEIYTQMLNGLNNPYGSNHGSVREYFLAQSYNQLDIEFDIVGPVLVSGSMATYGANDSQGDDKAPGKMVAEAVALADKDVDFSAYDWDGDGRVENIYVLYAGYGEANDGADPNTIWPHQWELSDPTNNGRSVKLDGVTVDTYACGSELMGISGNKLDGIGTMCHEYSHCLGLPDFYDTSTNGSNFGMDAWSVMDYGCYNGDGFCPAGYTAYERWFSGWLEPEELNAATDITGMPNIEEHPVAYVVYNDQNHNEYYLLENHQKTGWDTRARAHGMLVVHVDYDQNAWYNNTVNNTASRQRMTIIPADNTTSSTSLSGDLYPNGGKNTSLTDNSTPAAKLYRANTDGVKLMHKPITEITESNDLISFKFMGGAAALDTPVPVTDESLMAITSTSFTASWEDVDGAVSYNLRWSEKPNDGSDPADDVLEALLLYEDFDNLIIDDEDATADSGIDVAEELDEYMAYEGWTGHKVYEGLFGAKLSSSKEKGWLRSPVMEAKSGKTSIYLCATDWFNYNTLYSQGTYKHDGSKISVVLYDANGNALQTQTISADKISDDGYYFVLPDPLVIQFENVPARFSIGIEPTKRIYVYNFIAFDGLFDAKTIESIFEDEEIDDDLFAMPLHKTRKSVATGKVRRGVRRNASDFNNLVTDIKTTYFEFVSLTPGSTYMWQVQAVDEQGNTSAWSDIVTVTLPLDDAVDALRWPVSSADATVYDLAGRRADVSKRLRRGVYIVNGQKVVIQ